MNPFREQRHHCVILPIFSAAPCAAPIARIDNHVYIIKNSEAACILSAFCPLLSASPISAFSRFLPCIGAAPQILEGDELHIHRQP